MNNEEQNAPLPSQRQIDQDHYGWHYDQEDLDATQVVHPPALQPPLLRLPQQFSPRSPVSPQQPSEPPVVGKTPFLPQYQEPILDMGATLGYGQGEYQFFETPQPSQPIEKLRQDRLQQLREERMRRQQRRMMGPEATQLTTWNPQEKNFIAALLRSKQKQTTTSPTSDEANVASAPMAPSMPLVPPSVPDESATQGGPAALQAPTIPPLGLSLPSQQPRASAQFVPLSPASAPAATPSQDTGMIQKVQMGKATMLLSIAFVASRFLGQFRSTLFAFVFNPGWVTDSYTQAFFLPDLIFNIVAGGALTSAFIPIFTKYLIGDRDISRAWRLASSALNLAMAIMGVFGLIIFLFAPQLVPLYNLGIKDPETLNLIANLTRVMIFQAMIMAGGVIITSVLNAHQNFRLSAIGTVLYNVGLIGGLVPGLIMALTGHKNDELAIYFVAAGVVIGALLQVGIQLKGLRALKMRYTFSFDWKDSAILQIGKQMLPRILNASVLYVSILVDRNLIQYLSNWLGPDQSNGLITIYSNYAFQLQALPLGVLGMSMATAAFPTLAENVTKGRFDRVRNIVQETLRSIIFLSVPASMALIVIGFTVVQVLFQHGSTDYHKAYITAVTLAFFAIGITGHASVEILTRAFYAIRDTKTPVIISIAQFIFKILLGLMLITLVVFGPEWALGGLALSTSLAGILEAIVLLWLVHQRIVSLQLREIVRFIGKVLIGALVMGVALLLVRLLLDWLIPTNESALGLLGTGKAIFKLAIEGFIGLFVYIRTTRLLKIEELGPVKRVLDRLRLSWI